MNLVWFYFTYAEHLSIAAGQQSEEFPVLASKLWGQYAGGFWFMVGLMVIALWVLIAPKMLPAKLLRKPVFTPRYALASLAMAGLVLASLAVEPDLMPAASIGENAIKNITWGLLVLLSLGFLSGVTGWLKTRPVTVTVIASFCVVIGMWLERWNIVVPTMTHPRLIAYAAYHPTITEISLTAASVALFCMLFLIFFKLFPAVSIWEVAEGRVIEEAKSKVVIPIPEASEDNRQRSLGFRR
jgi:Ni/Fe-hydrogenase subunit HybB-like protein